MSNTNRKIYRRKKNSSLVPIISFLIVCGGISLGIASLWHNLSGDAQLIKDRKASQQLSSEDAKQDPLPQPAPEAKPKEEVPSSEVVTPVEDEPIVKPSTSSAFVGESERVKSEYFDDAAFVGDSITQGIQVYDIMSNATVVANTGLNPQSILTEKKIRTAGGYVTALEALQTAQPKKIYVMLGVNGIGFELDVFSNLYKELITKIKEQHPDSIIYIQSMLPVTKAYEEGANNPYNVTNAKINKYNDAIIKIAEELGVNYLDVASVMKDENGFLPDEASPTDGIHFGPKYYTKWFDYLKTHTA